MALAKLEVLPLPDVRQIKGHLWFKIKLDNKAKWRPDIIPLAKGFSNTERNIQLVCEGCNRLKGSDI